MMHDKRRWGLVELPPEKIAQMLAEKDNDSRLCSTYTLCTGFYWKHEGWVRMLLNDSTCEDALQEYALLQLSPSEWEEETMRQTVNGLMRIKQIESLTTSWMNAADLLQYMTAPVDIVWPYGTWEIKLDFQHHRCGRCA